MGIEFKLFYFGEFECNIISGIRVPTKPKEKMATGFLVMERSWNFRILSNILEN